jgi:hypothetical protein
VRNDKEDISKLPKWAQARIRVLESSVEHYMQQLSESAGGDGNSNDGPPIIASPYQEPHIRIPRGTNVAFMLDEGEYYHDAPSIICSQRLRESEGPWYLHIHASGSASARLVVLPECSNVLNLGIQRL